MASESRRVGRPPLDADDPSVTVNFRLPSKQYDALLRVARERRCQPADVLRQTVRHVIRYGDPNDRR